MHVCAYAGILEREQGAQFFFSNFASHKSEMRSSIVTSVSFNIRHHENIHHHMFQNIRYSVLER